MKWKIQQTFYFDAQTYYWRIRSKITNGRGRAGYEDLYYVNNQFPTEKPKFRIISTAGKLPQNPILTQCAAISLQIFFMQFTKPWSTARRYQICEKTDIIVKVSGFLVFDFAEKNVFKVFPGTPKMQFWQNCLKDFGFFLKQIGSLKRKCFVEKSVTVSTLLWNGYKILGSLRKSFPL